MNANPILLQMKYTRLIELLAKKLNISYDEALNFFYKSKTYKLISEGISDMHCMSDEYLAYDLVKEYNSNK
jgi:hypothetical protein